MMNRANHPGLSPLARKALAAMTEAVDEIKDECRRTGDTMVVWRDGRVCHIHPDAPPVIRETPRSDQTRKPGR